MEQGDEAIHEAQADHTGDTTQFTGPAVGDSEAVTLPTLLALTFTDTKPTADTLPVSDKERLKESDTALEIDAVSVEDRVELDVTVSEPE